MAKKPSESPSNKVEKYTDTLRCVLTPEEIAERAHSAATKVAERDRKESEQKASAKHQKSIIDQIDGEIRKLSNEVATKEEYRSVDCERVYNYATGVVHEYRLDTGETLVSRPMAAAERQRELPFEDGEDDQ